MAEETTVRVEKDQQQEKCIDGDPNDLNWKDSDVDLEEAESDEETTTVVSKRNDNIQESEAVKSDNAERKKERKRKWMEFCEE